MRRVTFEAGFVVTLLTVCLVIAVNWVLDLPHQVHLSPILALLALPIGASIGYAVMAFADFADGRPALWGVPLGVATQLLALLMMPPLSALVK